MNRNTAALCLLTMALHFSLHAQEFDREKMDSFLDQIESHNRGMGSLSIFQDGKEVYQKSIGFASVEKEMKATPDTRYRIGSITKTFTAAIIMQLIEEGRLSLGTTLDTYFPEIENAKEITLEHLLRHRSGIVSFTNAESYQEWMEQPVSEEALLDTIVSLGSTFHPGEKTGYSNSNYVLLTLILQEIEGNPYPDILEERIGKKCLLEQTYYGGRIDPGKGEAFSYMFSEEWSPSTETDMTIPMGAGGIVSTPTDLNQFLTCLFDEKVVSGESLEKMITVTEGLGMGMFPVPFFERQAFGHTGGIDAFQSNAFYFPEERVSVAYTSNGAVMPVNDLMIGVLSIYFGRDYALPDFGKRCNSHRWATRSYLPKRSKGTLHGRSIQKAESDLCIQRVPFGESS